jgi:hypothetical protein
MAPVTAVAASDWTINNCLSSALAMPKKFIAPPEAEPDDRAMVKLQSELTTIVPADCTCDDVPPPNRVSAAVRLPCPSSEITPTELYGELVESEVPLY